MPIDDPEPSALIPVLLVDDDVELCSMLSSILATEGFSPTAVHHAASDLHEALSNTHQMVVLDIMLPKRDGRAVLKQCRSNSPPHLTQRL